MIRRDQTEAHLATLLAIGSAHPGSDLTEASVPLIGSHVCGTV